MCDKLDLNSMLLITLNLKLLARPRKSNSIKSSLPKETLYCKVKTPKPNLTIIKILACSAAGETN